LINRDRDSNLSQNQTALDLSPQQWSSYHLTRPSTTEADPERWRRGWQIASFLATLLREQFGASRVAVFGSLNHSDCFDANSDIDLVAWGIPPALFYQAVAAVTSVSSEFEVDLVDGDSCSTSFLNTLAIEAVTL
jgi:predicted nucleotidyltransferase